MSKFSGFLFFVLTLVAIGLSYIAGPYFLLILIPVAFLLKYDLSEEWISIKIAFSLTLFNTCFYIFDVKLDLWSKNYSSEAALAVLAATNILSFAVYIFCLKKITASKNKQVEAIIQKFQQEKADIVKVESDVNHKLKDYKLEFSQKLSVIKKLLEIANSEINENRNINENLASVFKNVLKLDKFIFFKYYADKNSFLKIHEELIEVNDVKHSKFLHWIIERSFNFPKDINLLTKAGVDRNPMFTKLVKEDKNFPDLFIPVKKGNSLLGFVLCYDKKTNESDNEFKALATLLAEISSLIFQRS